MCEKKGDIEEIYEEVEIEWQISDFFSIDETVAIESPTFCLTDSSRFFRLAWTRKPWFAIFALCSMKPFEYSVKYNLELIKRDGSVELLSKGILKEGKNQELFFKQSEVLELKCEVESLDVITIACTLKRENTYADQPRNKGKLKKLISK